MRKKFILAVIMAFGGILADNTPAVCVYNKEANAIRVYDYSESVPCRIGWFGERRIRPIWAGWSLNSREKITKDVCFCGNN